MAKVIISLKIMPQSPDVDLDAVQTRALEIISEFGSEGETKQEKVPIAFGLQALTIMFVVDEDIGANTEKLEEKLCTIEGISTAQVTDLRRALG